MNISYVIRQLGKLLMVLSGALLFVALWSAVEAMGSTDEVFAVRETGAMRALLFSVGGGMLVGWLCWVIARRATDTFLGRREALLLVASSWIVGAGLAAMPYWLWAMTSEGVSAAHPFRSLAACYFEAMSGLTTTGATVMGTEPDEPGYLHIENLPLGLLLWRSMTQWLGGLGIIVLFVAVLPMVGVGGKKIFQAEATGPTTGGVRPRIAETARVLWILYLAMTGLLIALLWLLGGERMNLFNAVCHAFSTLSTGGFSTSSQSISYFDSISVEVIIIIFMLLGGINFGLYYQVIRKHYKNVLFDRELRLYLVIIAVASAIVTAGLMQQPIVNAAGVTESPSWYSALRYAVFQVISIQTSTGYATADFDLWGFLPKASLVTLMFIGGCAGSTAGGIKVIRILIAFRVILFELERVFRPNVVRTLKLGRMTIDPELRQMTLMYVLTILSIFLLGGVLLMVMEGGKYVGGQPVDFTSCATASAATLNNVGPGLGMVGAVQNYGWFSAPSLMLMSLLMAIGRLELFAILVLFVPRFWKNE